MVYIPKLKVLFEILEKYNYHEIPILVGGYLNLDLRKVHGSEFIEFMRTELVFELSSDLGTSTLRNSTSSTPFSITTSNSLKRPSMYRISVPTILYYL